MLKFTEQVKLRNSSKLVMLYNGVDMHGKSFFVYFLSDDKQIRLMRDDYQKGTARKIGEYGQMLYSDYLPEPDAKAIDFLNKWVADNGGSHM